VNTYQLESKTTINSDSQLELVPAPSGDIVIRVVRVGPYVLTLKQFDGVWTVHRRYRRNDFPSTLQVGLTCYTDWPTASSHPPAEHNRIVIHDGNPDLLALVDYMRYARPPAALMNVALDNASAISDAQILAALGP
jgi:hypothetical protein